jgi:hypothetical protein
MGTAPASSANSHHTDFSRVQKAKGIDQASCRHSTCSYAPPHSPESVRHAGPASSHRMTISMAMQTAHISLLKNESTWSSSFLLALQQSTCIDVRKCAGILGWWAGGAKRWVYFAAAQEIGEWDCIDASCMCLTCEPAGCGTSGLQEFMQRYQHWKCCRFNDYTPDKPNLEQMGRAYLDTHLSCCVHHVPYACLNLLCLIRYRC